MPEQSSPSAGAVIGDALRRARAEGTNQIGEEHLFAALLNHPDCRPLFLGHLAGPEDAEAVLAEVRRARRRGGITADEDQALAGLGIDLDEVLAHVEAQFGEGALDDSREPGRRGRRVSMSPEVTAALVDAVRRQKGRARAVTAQHLLLGILAQPGLVGDALRDRGLTVAGVLEAMDDGDAHAGARR